MRRPLGEACRKQFRKMMTQAFPDYKEDKTQIVPQGRYVWTSVYSPTMFFHILLVISPTSDEFTTGAAWDVDGRIPSTLSLPDKREAIFLNPLLFRPAFIWSGEDYWWRLVPTPEEEVDIFNEDPIEKCLPLVGPAVQDAGRKLKKYLIPVFEEIARRRS